LSSPIDIGVKNQLTRDIFRVESKQMAATDEIEPDGPLAMNCGPPPNLPISGLSCRPARPSALAHLGLRQIIFEIAESR
jgi:hypothetical protein